jgi:hypothetical protein
LIAGLTDLLLHAFGLVALPFDGDATGTTATAIHEA